MALSEKTKSYLKYALASQEVADEVIAYLEAETTLETQLLNHISAPDAHPQYLKKGSVIWCLPGGEYASLQEAIDVASAGQTVVVGEGSWGDATLKGGVSVVGLGAPRNTNISVGQLSFAPTSGNVLQNEIFLSNLFINPSAANSGIVLGGTAPTRLNMSGCYVYKGSGTAPAVFANNTDLVFTSLKMDNCIVLLGAATGTSISSSVRYLKLTNIEVSGGNKGLIVTGGLAQVAFSSIEVNNATSEIITVNTGTIETTSTSLIRNLSAGGSGFFVDAGGTVVVSTMTTFDIADGSGYCIKGSGAVIYDSVSFNHIPVIQPRNTKFQDTLTVIQLPMAPTIAP